MHFEHLFNLIRSAVFDKSFIFCGKCEGEFLFLSYAPFIESHRFQFVSRRMPDKQPIYGASSTTSLMDRQKHHEFFVKTLFEGS